MGELRRTPVDLQVDGVLWAINRVLFHPRGFALGIERVDVGNDDDPGIVASYRFELLGDGTEPWRFEDVPEDVPRQTTEDDLFRAFESLLREAGLRTGGPEIHLHVEGMTSVRDLAERIDRELQRWRRRRNP